VLRGTKTETDLSSCQSEKILWGLGHDFSKEANDNSAHIFVSNPYIKEDLQGSEMQRRLQHGDDKTQATS
jgi:hypothetical protein